MINRLPKIIGNPPMSTNKNTIIKPRTTTAEKPENETKNEQQKGTIINHEKKKRKKLPTTACYSSLKHKLLHHKGISVATLNTRSLEPRVAELREMFKATELDILAVTETWCDDTKTREIEIDGYNIVRKDRNRHGGGVLIYIRNGINFKERQDLEHPDVETTWIEVEKLLCKAPTLLGAYYRPPDKDGSYYDNTVDMLSKASAENKEMILLGDFNWNYTLDGSYHTNPVRYLEDLLEARQLVDQPTRVATTTSKKTGLATTTATTIDLILTTQHNDHTYTGLCETGCSDHFMPYTIIKSTKPPSIEKTATMRCHQYFKDFGYEEFHTSLQIQLQELPESDNTQDAWNNWKEGVLYISNAWAPITSRKVRSQHKSYITADIIKLMHERDRTLRKANQEQDPSLRQEYKKLRNLVLREIRKSKHNAMEELVTTRRHNPIKFWKDVSTLLPRKINMASIPKNLNLDDLNTYFSTIGGKNITEMEHKKMKQGMPWKGQVSMHNFKIMEVQENDVTKLLAKLPDKPNLDILGLDSKLLRDSAHIIAPSLTKIFNLSITEGEVVADWKRAKVSPAYKGKGDKEDPGNYRPISVMGHIPKIMEKLVGTQFINYLTDHNFITPDQSAYLSKHSSQGSLHRLVDDILEGANDGEVTAACFLDISKCFDSICHDYLLCKLQHYGIRQDIGWFKSYLTDRTQQVIHMGNLSKPLPVNSGVPQGSVLGPFLFILFANDLSNFVQGGLVNCYADDTVIYTSAPTANEAKTKLEKCLTGVEYWYTENKLKVNVDKSMIMLFGTHKRLLSNNNSDAPVKFGSQDLKSTHEYKYLGLLMDPLLSWNNQCEAVVKKSVFKLHLMRRLAKFLHRDTLIQIYKTYLMPIIEYGCTVWGYTSLENIKKINHIINTAARIITNNYDYINIRGAHLAKQLCINSFEDRRDFLLSVLTFKAVNGLSASYMMDKLTPATELATYTTRSASINTLYKPMANITAYERSFNYQAPHLWNQLSNDLKHSTNVLSFKEQYKKELLGQPAK